MPTTTIPTTASFDDVAAIPAAILRREFAGLPPSIDPRDLLQAGALAAIRSLATHRPEKGSPATHAWGCARGRMLRELNALRFPLFHRRSAPWTALDHPAVLPLSPRPARRRADPEPWPPAVFAALDALPSRELLSLEGVVVADRRPRDLDAEHGWRPGTASKCVRRALERLRAALTEEDFGVARA